jgi:hypothetical protein
LINLDKIPTYLTLPGSLMPCDNLPVRFIFPGKSGIKQREYFLIISLCNNTPMGSRNLKCFGKGIRGIWVTYTEMTLRFHKPNRLSLMIISTLYFAMIYMVKKKRNFKEQGNILRKESGITWIEARKSDIR